MTMTPPLICPDAFLSPLEIDATVTRALAEDLGRPGDVISIPTIPKRTQARALMVAGAGVSLLAA
jgi:nicotinate-nucleotide pyrophosphorylase (carboxylating)